MASSKDPFVLYGLSQEAKEHIGIRFADYPTKGRNSPKQRWVKALIYIGLLEPDISEKAFSLWQRGLQIAMRRRGQIDLRDATLVNEKIYSDEEPQLRRVVAKYRDKTASMAQVAYRLSNILYYLVHIYAQTGGMSEFQSNYCRFCDLSGIPPVVAFHCAIEKMTDRASREQKDEASEMFRIERVLANFQLS